MNSQLVPKLANGRIIANIRIENIAKKIVISSDNSSNYFQVLNFNHIQ